MLANETSHRIIMITISYNVHAISDISWYGHTKYESDHALIYRVIFGKKKKCMVTHAAILQVLSCTLLMQKLIYEYMSYISEKFEY